MKRAEAVLLVAPIVAGLVAEARGLAQTDRDPVDRATYSAGGRALFRLDTLAGRACFVLAVGAVVEWFVPHMINGAIARAAELVDDALATIDTEETP